MTIIANGIFMRQVSAQLLPILKMIFLLKNIYAGNINTYYTIYLHILIFEASRGAGAQSETVKQTGCEFDPHSRR